MIRAKEWSCRSLYSSLKLEIRTGYVAGEVVDERTCECLREDQHDACGRARAPTRIYALL